MKKLLWFLVLSVICVATVRYFHLDFSWFTEVFADDASNMADMNQPLPQAVLQTVDQGYVDLEGYKGKVVLISFWTTWCPGCRDEMPELIKLQQKFGSDGFTVVAISVDDQGEESVENFVQTEHFPVDGASATINFPVLLGNEEVAQKLGFEGGLPASILVSRDSKEVKIIRGPLTAQVVSRAIRHLL